MRFEGRTISPGKATGGVLRLDEPLSFLGGVDEVPETWSWKAIRDAYTVYRKPRRKGGR